LEGASLDNAVLGTNLDAGGNDVQNVGSIDTDLASIDGTTETISSGDIPYSSSYIQVNGEGGAEDDLETISGGSDGDLVILTRADNDNITVVTNAGGPNSILTSDDANKTISFGDSMTLLYVSNGVTERWFEI